MSSAYSFAGGSLRLKGDTSSSIKNGKVSKKHKHKHGKSTSVEAPSANMERVSSTANTNGTDHHSTLGGGGAARRDTRTVAEIAYDKEMGKRAEEKVLQKAAKSHKEQVEELNSYLDKLTEYNDIPKVSWTK
jgi:protein FAM32A